MEINSSPNRNYIQRNGFVMVSNLLLEYQQVLNLSNDELSFIIKVMKNREGYAVHDTELDPTVSTRTLQRRRKSLKEKGYLSYSIIKNYNSDGHISTVGIIYDLSKLEETLQKISDNIEIKKAEKIKKDIEEKGLIVEKDDNDGNLEKYFKDWEYNYGTKYSLTKEEKRLYNNLSSKDKECISKIFDYCNDTGIIDKITPRLILFFKTKWRFNMLRQWCYDSGYVKSAEEDDIEKEMEEQDKKRKEDNKKNFILLQKFYKEFNGKEIEIGKPFNSMMAHAFSRTLWLRGNIFEESHRTGIYRDLGLAFDSNKNYGEKLIFKGEEDFYDGRC